MTLQHTNGTPVNSAEYWKLMLRLELYLAIETARIKNNWTKEYTGLVIGLDAVLIDKIPSGECDLTLEKLVEVSLCIGLVPVIYFSDENQK